MQNAFHRYWLRVVRNTDQNMSGNLIVGNHSPQAQEDVCYSSPGSHLFALDISLKPGGWSYIANTSVNIAVYVAELRACHCHVGATLNHTALIPWTADADAGLTEASWHSIWLLSASTALPFSPWGLGSWQLAARQYPVLYNHRYPLLLSGG